MTDINKIFEILSNFGKGQSNDPLDVYNQLGKVLEALIKIFPESISNPDELDKILGTLNNIEVDITEQRFSVGIYSRKRCKRRINYKSDK